MTASDDIPVGILVGRIGAPHGLKGEVKLKSFTADPKAIGRYGPLHTQSGRVLTLAALKPAKDVFIARFDGVTDRNGSEALAGEELYVARAMLPPAEEGSYYLSDLIGLDVVDGDGARIGTLRAVHDFGAGAVIEITGDDGRELMLPFADDFVPGIDMAARRVIVRVPGEIVVKGSEDGEGCEDGEGREDDESGTP